MRIQTEVKTHKHIPHTHEWTLTQNTNQRHKHGFDFLWLSFEFRPLLLGTINSEFTKLLQSIFYNSYKPIFCLRYCSKICLVCDAVYNYNFLHFISFSMLSLSSSLRLSAVQSNAHIRFVSIIAKYRSISVTIVSDVCDCAIVRSMAAGDESSDINIGTR